MKAVCLVEKGAPLMAVVLDDPVAGQGQVVIRVTAAGICHSDAHYRAGTSSVSYLPIVLGHEIAGVVESVGPDVDAGVVGTRRAVHYLVGCGNCSHCRAGHEALCATVEMLGKNRNGGFAERVVVPFANALLVPDEVPDAVAAIAMCSTSTALHALRRACFRPGCTVAVFGCGGLGMSAIALARALGASRVFAVDVSGEKLKRAAELGAHALDANEQDAANAILAANGRQGVDVALEFVGRPETVDMCIRATGKGGRTAMVALADIPMPVYTYRDLIAREIDVVGVSDHTRVDLLDAMSLLRTGKLELSSAVTAQVPLDAAAVNGVLDRLESRSSDVRTVIRPGA